MEIIDVVVVGGGPAGLQAALVLGRSRRTVVVADGGKPRNAPAAAVHNLLGSEGIAPEAFLAQAQADVSRYGVEIVPAEVAGATWDGQHWSVRFTDGSPRLFRALVLATGLVEELPKVDGVAALWGGDVVACPYCHGWEVRGKAVAVLGGGPRAWQQLLLLQRFTEDLVLISNGAPGLDEYQERYLDDVGIGVLPEPVARVRHADGRLAGVEFASGEVLARDALFVVTGRRQASDLASQLGCDAVEQGPGAPGIRADADGYTGLPNVWAAGSMVNPSLTVIGSAGHASTVAIAVNNALIAQEVDRRMRR